MAFTVIRQMKIPGNVDSIRGVILAAATGDAGDVVIGLDPNRRATIHVTKPTSGGSVFLTNTTFKLDGSRISDVDDADILWNEVSTGTDPYWTGDEKGLTGIKIVSAVSPTTTDINYSVTQIK